MSSSLEAKIVILGSQGVGKTSLVQRYVKNAFNPVGTASTVGASFVTKRVLDSSSDTIVRLQIWDTAGQERFRSISKLYYRGANACLLCYDITDEQSFLEMTGWLVELKKNLGDEDPVVIHVVGTKSDIVALDPLRRAVPFERTIAYVAEQLYPSLASTPPPTAGVSHSSSTTLQGLDSKRSSGFWGQDIGWDCCHEISAKDGEGIEEVFQVITRKLVEQRNKQLGITSSQGSTSGLDGVASPVGPRTLEGNGSFRLGHGDNRRSWLGFPPSSVGDELDERIEITKKKGKCC
ncbi:hypothetical protein RU639_008965 [Aspergillus parasiticus]|uniref:Ras-like GTP-binding protein n=2 Tax=Aspergillus subgen. Circumdati TaxID=2720871 RepID=A0A2G7FLE1_9EURO|nr:P-loop containing nucleoside triphosphate hydrolase protein [Aspergillus transmontanensis]KAE8346468.1 hypothetical protein BDV24DRAFT_123937 [Aspergillus arachidicola]PIG81460.1 ras-like GTP-binding protein [Aspergillus arachidicola]